MEHWSPSQSTTQESAGTTLSNRSVGHQHIDDGLHSELMHWMAWLDWSHARMMPIEQFNDLFNAVAQHQRTYPSRGVPKRLLGIVPMHFFKCRYPGAVSTPSPQLCSVGVG